MKNAQSRIFEPSFLLEGADLQRLMLSLVKGGLNKQARDSIGMAIAQHVNRVVAPGLGGLKIKLDQRWGTAVNSLRDVGYAMIDNVFDPAAIAAIYEYIKDKPVMYGQESGYNQVGGRAEGPLEDMPAGTRFAHYKTPDLLACPEIYQAVHNFDLIGTITAYLGAPPTVSSVSLWWSFPVDLPAAGMQMYHHDRGDFRSVNLFVYLTDVTETTGPHAFVERTHEMNILHPLSVKLFGSDPKRMHDFWTWMENHRKTDEEVRSFFPAELIKSFTGPQGTSFLEDTRGQHKGTLPTKGKRVAFEIVYSTLPKYNEVFSPVRRTELGLPPSVETDNANIHPLARYATRLMYT